jgi:hypothetical protein
MSDSKSVPLLPDGRFEHLIDELRTAGAMILRIAYGYEIEETDDPFIKISDKAMEEFSLSATPGAFIVDTFPACD